MEKGERELRRELEEARGEGEDWKVCFFNLFCYKRDRGANTCSINSVKIYKFIK